MDVILCRSKKIVEESGRVVGCLKAEAKMATRVVETAVEFASTCRNEAVLSRMVKPLENLERIVKVCATSGVRALAFKPELVMSPLYEATASLHAEIGPASRAFSLDLSRLLRGLDLDETNDLRSALLSCENLETVLDIAVREAGVDRAEALKQLRDIQREADAFRPTVIDAVCMLHLADEETMSFEKTSSIDDDDAFSDDGVLVGGDGDILKQEDPDNDPPSTTSPEDEQQQRDDDEQESEEEEEEEAYSIEAAYPGPIGQHLARLISANGNEETVAAILALSNLASEGDEIKSKLVEAGVIAILVKFLELEPGTCKAVKTAAAAALANLGYKHPANKVEIARQGALSPLLRLLDGADGEQATFEAVGALMNLSVNEENKIELGNLGAPRLLFPLMCVPKFKDKAAGTVWNMVNGGSPEMKRLVADVPGLLEYIVSSRPPSTFELGILMSISEECPDRVVNECNAVSRCLANALETQTGWAQAHAAGALLNLSLNEEFRPKCAEASLQLVDALVRGDIDRTRENAAGAILNLAVNPDGKTVLAVAIEPLVQLLESGTVRAKAFAAGALLNLAKEHHPNKVAIVQAGATSPLQRLLVQGDDDLGHIHAAGAIWNLSLTQGFNIDVEAILSPLFQLLNLESDEANENAAGAISAIARNKQNREYFADPDIISALIDIAENSPCQGAREQAGDALYQLANSPTICDMLHEYGYDYDK